MKLRKLTTMIIVTYVALLSSCDKENNTDQILEPKITKITSLSDRNNPLEQTKYGEWIMIHGNNLLTASAVSFNGEAVSKENFYAEDNNITIKIPETLPDPQNNPITITTSYGQLVFPFQILQPKSVINQISPSIGNPGEIVTIEGLYFNGVSNVKFGDENAEIISSTLTEIKVKIPPSAFGNITVTTPSGTSVSTNIFGIKHLIFTEGLHTNWSNTSYTGNFSLANTTQAKRGQYALSASYGGWGAIRLQYSQNLVRSNFTAVKFSVYAESANLGKKIRLYLNNSSATGSYTITIDKVNEWVEYQIPLTAFGNITNITSFLIQEYSGQDKRTLTDAMFYFDDIGFL